MPEPVPIPAKRQAGGGSCKTETGSVLAGLGWEPGGAWAPSGLLAAERGGWSERRAPGSGFGLRAQGVGSLLRASGVGPEMSGVWLHPEAGGSWRGALGVRSTGEPNQSQEGQS